MPSLWSKLRLKLKDTAARQTAVAELEASGALDAHEMVLNCLGDDGWQVRPSAASSLPSGKNGLVKRDLSALEDGPGTEDRKEAALRRLAWESATRQEQAAHTMVTLNPRAAALGAPATVPTLLRQLTHATSSIRRAAAEALAQVNDPRAILPLVNALNDKDHTVRVSTVHALSKARAKPAIAALLRRLLNDSAAGVRMAAAEVLAKCDDPSLEAPFLKLLLDEHFEVRLAAVRFLGRTGNLNHADALIRMLRDVDHDVREAAAIALGEFKTPEAIEGLVLALSDEERAVRKAAEMALDKTDPNWANSDAAQRASEQLEMLLLMRPAWVRSAVGHLLTKLRNSEPVAEAVY